LKTQSAHRAWQARLAHEEWDSGKRTNGVGLSISTAEKSFPLRFWLIRLGHRSIDRNDDGGSTSAEEFSLSSPSPNRFGGSKFPSVSKITQGSALGVGLR